MIVRQATVHDAASLQGRLRKQDYDEVWATHGYDPDAIMVLCAAHSAMLWCAEIENRVEAICGVAASDVAGEGQPWMLGTDVLAGFSKALLRIPSAILPHMHARFPVLRNKVDARNTVSIRWLKHIGFAVAKYPVPSGAFGLPFYEFCKEVDICV